MVAVVLVLQLQFHLLHRTSLSLGQFTYGFLEVGIEFLLRNATQGLILFHHTDVGRLVEAAEYAYLRELRHTGEENKTEIGIGRLENSVKTPQNVTMHILKRTTLTVYHHAVTCIQDIQYGFIILVNQNHGPATCLQISLLQHISESCSGVIIIWTTAIGGLPSENQSLDFGFQGIRLCEVRTIEVYMEYRISVPLLFQPVNGQSAEQLFPAQKIVLQGGDQQAFPETSRTAQEIDLSLRDKTIDKVGLVHVHVTVLYNLLKTLYANRVLHNVLSYMMLPPGN